VTPLSRRPTQYGRRRIDFQGYLNGAVETGERVVDEIFGVSASAQTEP
jgi:hypothetical protein